MIKSKKLIKTVELCSNFSEEEIRTIEDIYLSFSRSYELFSHEMIHLHNTCDLTNSLRDENGYTTEEFFLVQRYYTRINENKKLHESVNKLNKLMKNKIKI